VIEESDAKEEKIPRT